MKSQIVAHSASEKLPFSFVPSAPIYKLVIFMMVCSLSPSDPLTPFVLVLPLSNWWIWGNHLTFPMELFLSASLLQETLGGRHAFSVLMLTLKHQGALVILSWGVPLAAPDWATRFCSSARSHSKERDNILSLLLATPISMTGYFRVLISFGFEWKAYPFCPDREGRDKPLSIYKRSP